MLQLLYSSPWWQGCQLYHFSW